MKALKNTTLLFAMSAGVFACGGGEKQTVETGDAQEVKASTGTELTVDTEASSLEWIGYKDLAGAFQYSHVGTVDIAGGSLNVDGDQLTGGKVMIDMTTIASTEDMPEEKANNLIGHLKSPDFFAVINMDEEGNVTGVNEDNKMVTFEITNVSAYEAPTTEEGDGMDEWSTANPTHNVTGNLTIRGTTKSITFPAHVEIGEGMVSAQAKFHINRHNWGVSYMEGTEDVITKAKDQYIRDEMGIGFNLTAKTAPEATASM